ncbi:unnamed protein product [Aureobasidium uvarum]|uniref:Uncharacterized protein n=1 Tax=Aureobasidium uvarum TaxID=2773716 RepID=A0A9N8KGY7_9PEZI|nr:unnamed protein product [Aureobasidium uvarum]
MDMLAGAAPNLRELNIYWLLDEWEQSTLTNAYQPGDAHEVAIYRALGSLFSIRKVHLTVYCPQLFPHDEDAYKLFSGKFLTRQVEDQEMDTELDDALMNLAFDAQLAKSVFRTISLSKPAFSPPLESVSLRIGALDYMKFSSGRTKAHASDILKYIGRSWICTRNPRDDRPHDFTAAEYNPKAKVERAEALERQYAPKVFDSVVAQSVCRVWPAAKSGDWKKEWHSFSLAIS